ncbi:Alpha/beta hydrolase family protein [Novipirellula aureliae]|uniref:Alpha/beta hydrolase family protein n=1 Tax=Novipirellula aureliae TaxID=2527966 RepID=A0A5C6DH20_9BACT|nr:alpha/beta hydrolase [Novipirellula aureliae]TWU35304.1 Alpha/beta hydrolase family protein [Novipirellula aureliae]
MRRTKAILVKTLPSRQAIAMIVLFYFLIVSVASVAVGQEKAKGEDEGPQPTTETLKTKDGISLRAFYFPTDKAFDPNKDEMVPIKGTEVIPVILVHEWQGQGSPYLKLVLALNEVGCSVLVPEYRGHGGSKEYTDVRGRSQTFDPTAMGRADVAKIVSLDIEAAKQFLKKKNDDGDLNLNALVMIGVREGAVFASHFAVADWRWPSVGRLKQGQDVKALVLISPEKHMKGLAIDSTISDPNLIRLPIMVAVGKTSSEATEATRIAKRIEGLKRRLGQGEARGFKEEVIDTNLSGPALVNETDELIPAVVSFIKENVKISDSENPWIRRN